MNRSVFWALVRKDVYLVRGLIVLTVVVGVVSLFVTGFGNVGLAVGGVLFITACMASGIFIAMLSMLTERVDKSRLFALSLPVSGRQYGLAKLVGVYVAYGIPWLALTVLVLWAFLRPGADERGMVVYALLIMGSMLASFSVMVAWLYAVKAEQLAGIAILGINITFSLFMVAINQPSFTAPLHGQAIHWPPVALGLLAAEVLVLAASIAFVLVANARKRDYA